MPKDMFERGPDSWMARFNRCIAKLRGESIGGAVPVLLLSDSVTD